MGTAEAPRWDAKDKRHCFQDRFASLAEEERLALLANEECCDNQRCGAIYHDVPSSNTGPSDNWCLWAARGRERDVLRNSRAVNWHPSLVLLVSPAEGKGLWPEGQVEPVEGGACFLNSSGWGAKNKNELSIATVKCPQTRENWPSAHTVTLTFNFHYKNIPIIQK